ncbi:MAG: acyl-homoserine-lactone synthase [Terracidiphilus sp.]|nr:acyl-homoserine-lactone synthase [Terracidiphilus sp.]
MEDIVVTKMKNLSPAARQQLGLYRHTVFVKHMKWELPSVSAETVEEWDEFDRDDSTNVVAYTQDRRICGYARLLPTTQPYLLGEIFPDLCSRPLISDPFTWELSRFTTFHNGAAVNVQTMRRLLESLFLYSGQLGVRRLIGVAP